MPVVRLGLTILRFILVVTALWLAGPVQAAPRLLLQPVTLEERTTGDLWLAFTIPCGARFHGVVIKDAVAVTEIAVVVEQNRIVCAGLAKTAAVRASLLSPQARRHLRPLAVAEGQKANLVPFEGPLHRQRRPPGADHDLLAGAYVPRCGRTLGVLLRGGPFNGTAGTATGSSTTPLSVGVLESVTTTPASTCSLPITRLAIKALALPSALDVVPATGETPPTAKAYQLRLAAVQPASMRAWLTATGHFASAIAYQGACNEAPIGLVVGAPLPSDRDRRLPVAMLVAHFAHIECAPSTRLAPSGAPQPPAPQPIRSWQTFVVHGLALPHAGVRNLRRPLQLAPLELAAPLHLKTAGNGQITMEYVGGDGPAYGVYTNDTAGHLAIGVLTLQGSTDPDDLVDHDDDYKIGGNKNLANQQVKQPPIIAQGAEQPIFPLRLKRPG